MQVDASMAVAVIAMIVGTASTIIAALGRFALANREREIDRRLDAITRIDERLHAEEKSTIRQDGEIALVKQSHHGLDSDLEEIKRNMVTKVELTQLERAIERILTSKHPSQGGFKSPYPGGEGKLDK